ncbi:uncharacterized protein LOC122532412 isoform X2 [Frieseomelitta varia]|uniref:uncharacterized protein LOC122532412 isoform X2 n=1 Tax=Frieseomelitta varia TaxID=561572 RepID=UPI001CB68BCC|nr:uncharacterized protein LOC122532412 isoform X2 [Frieseomelitta varia]
MYDRSYARVDEQLRNIHYKNDIQYALQISEWLLKLIGMWPFVNSHATNKLGQLVSVILISTCFSSILFIILPTLHHIFFVEKNTYMKVKMIGPVSFGFSSAIKYCYLGTKGHFFQRCIQHVRKDWKTVHDPNYRTIMLKYAAINRKFITVCAAFLYSGALLYYTVMQFLSKGNNGKNNTFRPLAYPGSDAFLDSQSSPTYEIVFSIHCITGIIMCSITILTYSLAATFVTHVCGQIQIQITRLQDLVNSKKRNDGGRDPLSVIVYDHVKTLSFCVSSAIKYCYLGTKGHFFQRCIQHVRKDWKTVHDPNYRTIMLKYAAISRKLITVCAAFLYSGGMSYHTVMQFLSKGGEEENNTYRQLAYPGYDSFLDSQSTPTYEIVFSIHCITAIIMYSTATAAYSLAAIFVTHICGQIQIQIARLHNLVKSKQKKDVRPDPLSVIVHDHAEILRFSRNVEEAFREVCFAQIVESTMNM